MSDLISVIVPVYNMERYLARCVNSILAQDHNNLEVILVDDGSKDSSFSICQQFEEKDKRVKAIHKENGGQGSARNLGLDHMHGDYVAFVDSDDWIEPGMYSSLLRAMKKSNTKLGVCGMAYHYENGEVVSKRRVEKSIIIEKVEALSSLLTEDGRMTHSPCDKLFEKSLFENIRFLEHRLLEDTAFTYLMIDKAEEVIIIPEIGYDVFCDSSSVSRRGYNPRRCETIVTFREISDFVMKRNEYRSLVNTSSRAVAGSIFYNVGEAYCAAFDKRKETLNSLREIAKTEVNSNRKHSLKNRLLLEVISFSPSLFGCMYKITKH